MSFLKSTSGTFLNIVLLVIILATAVKAEDIYTDNWEHVNLLCSGTEKRVVRIKSHSSPYTEDVRADYSFAFSKGLTTGKILNLHVNGVNKFSDDCERTGNTIQCKNKLGDTTYQLTINSVSGTVNYMTGSDDGEAIVLTILNGNCTAASAKKLF